MATKSEGSQATSRAILVIAGILVLSALGYFAVKYFAVKSESEEKDLQIENLNTEVQQLEANVADFRNQINDLEIDLATKEQLLQDKVGELEKVQGLLAEARRSNKTQTSEIRRLESKVQELQAVLAEYDDIIASLKAENQALAGQVDSLREREGALISENRDLQARNQETRQELDRTVTVASALKARSFRFFSYKEGKKEKEFTTLARWRMKDLQLCFSILENQIATRGDRSVYAVIEDAAGNTLTNFTDGYSGRFPYQGQDKAYSCSASIGFFGTEIEECMVFGLADEGKFEKGVYYVFLYADNNLIGQSSFEIN